MVKLRDVQNMFWGVTLDGGKRYTQTVERSFHISMAALESGTETPKTKEKHVSVMIQHEKAEFVMCTLEFGRLYQQPLDLNFTEGEEVTFFLNGTGIVHLTGYLLDEGQYDDEMGLSGDSSESDDEAPELLGMEEEDSDDDSEDEDFAIEMAVKKDAKKRKAKNMGIVQKKKSKLLNMKDDSEDMDSDDSEELDSDEQELIRKLTIGKHMDDPSTEDEDDDEEEEKDDDESDEDDEEDQQVPAKSPKAKKQAKGKQTTKQQSAESASKDKSAGQNGVASTPNTEEKKKKKKKKKKKNKNKEGAESQQNTPDKSSANNLTKDTPKKDTPKPTHGQTPKNTPKPTPAQTPKNTPKPTPGQTPKNTPKPTPGQTPKETLKKRVFAGGVIVEDIKVGHGPEAKSGKQAQMYYVGALQDGKQFDSCKGGKPFKFKMGKGEVIRGWDVGVSGMKVGGKRKLVIPPTMGYGKQRQGPIPPNSTLVFEVELKAVS
ncbi:46 kDa FK506-binding nuclear protein-like [Haliotis cracherodii]|uniref:46 kDa FK506-binding nuclear protein-like n=1 Tax=Haliotis cracherodii TaxID=6455 RepID=UPI0039E7804F